MRIIAAAAALVAAFSLPAEAQMRCGQVSQLTALASANNVKAHELNPRQLEQAATWYNALPPESTDTFTNGVVLDMPNGALMFLGNQGVVCGPMPINQLTRRAILGGDA